MSLFVANKDHRPGDYKEMDDVPRPSHADYTYQIKYGIRASSGGGRSSARETIGRVTSRVQHSEADSCHAVVRSLQALLPSAGWRKPMACTSWHG